MNSELIESTINILQNEFVKSIYETALMIGISFSLSLIFGLTLGFILYLTSGKTFFEKTISLNKTVSAFINIIRSIPFIILVVFSLPLTFILVGTKIGPIAASVPLSIAAIVFFARLVESALKEVDAGVIEAAIATGASHFLIIKNDFFNEL